MSDAPPISAAAPLPAHRSPAAPLFLWLVIQLIALALAALRVPLSARFPLPGEQFAIHIMIVVQVTAAALLFPLLLRDATTTLMVILTTVPFLQLAAYLSSVSLSRAGLAGGYVACWIATLALSRAMLRTRQAEMLGVALALAWSVGGAVIWYVNAESREPARIDWSHNGLFGPILGGIAQIAAPTAVAGPWIVAIALSLVSGALSFLIPQRETHVVGRSGNSREVV
ncbi:MAG: hypothetical protein WBD40_00065 [Tepidisphaeraceae bacterium]